MFKTKLSYQSLCTPFRFYVSLISLTHILKLPLTTVFYKAEKVMFDPMTSYGNKCYSLFLFICSLYTLIYNYEILEHGFPVELNTTLHFIIT